MKVRYFFIYFSFWNDTNVPFVISL